MQCASTSFRLAPASSVVARRSQAARPMGRARAVRVQAASLVDTARQNGLNKFADALQQSGVVNAINDGQWTLFAPTDEAFASISNPGNVPLDKVLKFHVVAGKMQGRHIENFPSMKTMEGTPITVDTRSQKPSIVVGPAPRGMQGLAGSVVGGKITTTDLAADNGVIHVIDGVMIPEPPLVGQNGGYVAGTEPGSGEGRTGLDTKVSSSW